MYRLCLAVIAILLTSASGKRQSAFARNFNGTLETIRVGLYPDVGSVSDCALASPDYRAVARRCEHTSDLKIADFTFSLIQRAVGKLFRLVIVRVGTGLPKAEAYHRALQDGLIDLPGDLFSYTPNRSEDFQFYKVMFYQPYFLLLSRHHVRHYDNPTPVAIVGRYFCLVAVALALLSGLLLWLRRPRPWKVGTSGLGAGTAVEAWVLLCGLCRQAGDHRRRCLLTIFWLWATQEFCFHYQSLFRVSLIPARQLEFEGSLSLAEDLMSGTATLVHNDPHWSYFHHLIRPKSDVQILMKRALTVNPLVVTASEKETMRWLRKGPAYVTFYDFDLAIDSETHLIKEDADIPPRPMFLVTALGEPSPRMAAFLHELSNSMDFIFPLIYRFNEMRLAKVDHFMLEDDKPGSVPPHPLSLGMLRNVFFVLVAGKLVSGIILCLELLELNIVGLVELRRTASPSYGRSDSARSWPSDPRPERPQFPPPLHILTPPPTPLGHRHFHPAYADNDHFLY